MKNSFKYFCRRAAALAAVLLLTVLSVAGWTVPVLADTAEVDSSSGTVYLYDEADLLTDEEEQELESLLSGVSRRCGVPVIGVTLDQGMDEYALREFLADDILSAKFAGDATDGSSPDGIVYGIDIRSRCDSVVSGGSVYETLGQNELDDIRERAENQIAGAQKSDHAAFAAAFEQFADRSEYYLNKSVFYRLTRHLAADLVIAAIITVIVMMILVSMQKSHMEAGAASYADRRSVQMRRSQDIYLRTTVIHRQAPKNTGGGGGPHGSGSFTGGGGGNFGSSSGRF